MEMEDPVHMIKGSSHWESAIFINGCVANSFIHRCHDSRRHRGVFHDQAASSGPRRWPLSPLH